MDVKSNTSYPTITGYLNYDPNTDEYWYGILGWVPECVEEIENSEYKIGIKDGIYYQYLRRIGGLGEEVRVYFKKYDSSPNVGEKEV